MEELFCRTTECNLHDFEIRAGGVCKYIDHMWMLEHNSNPEPTLTRPDPLVKLMESFVERMEDVAYALHESGNKGNFTENPRTTRRDRRRLNIGSS